MQRIEIKAFGPVTHVDFAVNDILLFNGVQSSGKSTISKTVYFFKSIPETLFQAFMEDENIADDFEKKIVIACRRQFMSIFGTTKHFDDFTLKYDFAPGKFINIYKDHNSGHARIMFSQQLLEGLETIAHKLQRFSSEKNSGNIRSDFSMYRADRFQFFSSIKKELKELFEDTRRPFFVPAGRSLVSTLSGELKDIDSYKLDGLMREFVQRIFYLRDTFSKDLQEIVEDKKKLSAAHIDFERVSLAGRLIENILQGKYRFEGGEEKIMVDGDNYVKIKFASSGQQEILWILLLLFVEMLDNEPSFGVFEEPEAHLYPLTQYEVIKLMSLYASNPSNQAIITTHSPYIMAAVNNMLLAHKAAQSKSEKARQILPKLLWLDKERISAYFVEKGAIFDMFDSETGIIDTQYIDAASDAINGDFDELLALDDES